MRPLPLRRLCPLPSSQHASPLRYAADSARTSSTDVLSVRLATRGAADLEVHGLSTPLLLEIPLFAEPMPPACDNCTDCETASDCGDAGQCVDGQCVCSDGWGGADCRTRLCPNGCAGRGVHRPG